VHDQMNCDIVIGIRCTLPTF